MKFSTSVIAAAAAFLPAIEAHMRITKPAPYNGAVNSPLEANGSNFPCMNGGQAQRMEPGVTYTPGQAGSFKITGGATHGGGSCQVSITYDNPPKPDSVFKVVQSYHGGCPVPSNKENLSGNPDDDTIPEAQFNLPAGLKAGEAVFVWSWFNRIGNREMYMNCAPITIGGDGKDDTVFTALPDMFVANIEGHGSQCQTKAEEDILFPNPGDNVVEGKGDCNFQPACGGQAPPPPPKNTIPTKGGDKDDKDADKDADKDDKDADKDDKDGEGSYGGGNGNTQPTQPATGTTPTLPALVDVGKNPSATNTPPSDSYTPINPVEGGDKDDKDGEGSYGGDNGSVESGSGNQIEAPVADVDDTDADDNTGKKCGKLCTQDSDIMKCDGVPSGKYVQCYGKGKGWEFNLPKGVQCQEFASIYSPQPKAYRFKRHAYEHAKRHNRVHRH